MTPTQVQKAQELIYELKIGDIMTPPPLHRDA